MLGNDQLFCVSGGRKDTDESDLGSWLPYVVKSPSCDCALHP